MFYLSVDYKCFNGRRRKSDKDFVQEFNTIDEAIKEAIGHCNHMDNPATIQARLMIDGDYYDENNRHCKILRKHTLVFNCGTKTHCIVECMAFHTVDVRMLVEHAISKWTGNGKPTLAENMVKDIMDSLHCMGVDSWKFVDVAWFFQLS